MFVGIQVRDADADVYKRQVIEVEDDGVGMAATQLVESTSTRGAGIGMANISERLQVLYLSLIHI